MGNQWQSTRDKAVGWTLPQQLKVKERQKKKTT